MIKKIWIFLAFIAVSSLVATAQETCPGLVQYALERVQEICENAGRNQVCYGNYSIEAEALEDLSDFTFSNVGDIADVLQIRQMTLSPLNEDSGEWGISVMRLQANLPDTLPGQNVMFILFGDVTMDVVQRLELDVVVNANAINIRGGASTSDPIVGQASSGDTLLAIGRNEAGDWIQIRYGEDEEIGWIATFLIEANDQLNSLSVINGEDTANNAESFYFRTGIGDSNCVESPESGILVQTPQGAGEIQLTVNGVDISLGSTAYIQINEDSGFSTYLLEGQGQLNTLGLTQAVPEGYVFTITLDEDLRPTEEVWAFEGYDSSQLQALPVTLLDRQIEIAEPREPTYYNILICDVAFGPPIEAGQVIYIQGGIVGYPSPEALENDLNSQSGIISVDGESLPIISSGPPEVVPGDNNGYVKSENVAWIPTSGPHTFVSDYSHASNPPYLTQYSCTITVP